MNKIDKLKIQKDTVKNVYTCFLYIFLSLEPLPRSKCRKCILNYHKLRPKQQENYTKSK